MDETTENVLDHSTCSKQTTTLFDITYNLSQISNPKIPFKRKEGCADEPKQKWSSPKVSLMLSKKAKLSKLKARKTAATSNEVYKLVQVMKKRHSTKPTNSSSHVETLDLEKNLVFKKFRIFSPN